MLAGNPAEAFPLHAALACCKPAEEVLQVLHEQAAAPHTEDTEGLLPLHWATARKVTCGCTQACPPGQ